jgi:hypothetical protein
VRERELRSLVDLARREERDFFRRNPHLVAPYRGRLLAVCLCQGAALQYLRVGYGVSDFDIHFFYLQNPSKRRLSRAVRRIHPAAVGRIENMPVDFVRTVVPALITPARRGTSEHLRAFLRDPPTANATHLAEKAVIGLLPKRLFGEVIWRPEDRDTD